MNKIFDSIVSLNTEANLDNLNKLSNEFNKFSSNLENHSKFEDENLFKFFDDNINNIKLWNKNKIKIKNMII